MISILGYSDKMSAVPGETLRFMVSCEDGAPAYDARIVRLMCTDDHPEGPGRKEHSVDSPVTGRYPGRRQAIVMGSCAVLPGSAALDRLESFTVQVLIWATTPAHHRQGLVTRWCNAERRGFGLVIDGGSTALVLGYGGTEPRIVSSETPLVAREWYRVTASYHARDGTARIAQTPLFAEPVLAAAAEVVRPVGRDAYRSPGAPLLFGAWKDAAPGGGFADGRTLQRQAGSAASDRRGPAGGRHGEPARREHPGSLGLLARHRRRDRHRPLPRAPARTHRESADPRGHGSQLDRRTSLLAGPPGPLRRHPLPRRRPLGCVLGARFQSVRARRPGERRLCGASRIEKRS